jgi:hypothetical protein
MVSYRTTKLPAAKKTMVGKPLDWGETLCVNRFRAGLLYVQNIEKEG